MGVSHAGEPDEMVLDRVKRADVVTLELTRQVVQAGLRGEDSQILRNNSFWRGIIESLRSDTVNKRIRGVEVNQSPRVAWKRLSLHYGNPTLASSPFTIEVSRDRISDFYQLLSETELTTLKDRSWLITNNRYITDAVCQRLEEVTGALKDWGFPVEMSPGIFWVCSASPEESDKTDDYRYKITFMTPPHPSLIEAFELIKRELGDLNLLKETEVNSFAFDVMLTYLLSPPELTEAREIAYVSNQSVRDPTTKPNQKTLEVVHVGGAHHTERLERIFQASLPVNPRITINTSYDSNYLNFVWLGPFFRDYIPFDRRMLAVRVTGFETEVVPELIGQDVVTAVVDNRDDFNERLAKYRASRQLGKG